MDQWFRYLYEQHTEAELKNWASRLRYFRYYRAYGGHANDGDSLDMALNYSSPKMLIDTLRDLGIEPTQFANEPERPTPGTSYTHEEYTAFPSVIPGTEWIEQPGHREIWGVKVFIWCDDRIIKISASPWSYDVTTEHVLAAEMLETKLSAFKERLVDPPRDTKHYVCPKYYPHIFK